MDLRLVREVNRHGGIERETWNLSKPLPITCAGAPSGVCLGLQLLDAALVLGEPLAVNALQVAVDILLANDRLDPVDHGHVTRCRDARTAAAAPRAQPGRPGAHDQDIDLPALTRVPSQSRSSSAVRSTGR